MRQGKTEKFGSQKEGMLIKKRQSKIEVSKESIEGRKGSRKVLKSEIVGCKPPDKGPKICYSQKRHKRQLVDCST